MTQRKDDPVKTEASGNEPALLPAVDVLEDGDGITLYADLPGVSRDKLNIKVESDTLIIEGSISLPKIEQMEATHAELRLPKYRRAFTLGKELDADKVSAELRQGVLKLRIPKAEHAKPRKIEIQVA